VIAPGSTLVALRVRLDSPLHGPARVKAFDPLRHGASLIAAQTRGVDVGAKSQIFALLQDLTARGVSVIFISSELEEVLSVADRILTMHRGRIVAETLGTHTDIEHILLSATGGLSADVEIKC